VVPIRARLGSGFKFHKTVSQATEQLGCRAGVSRRCLAQQSLQSVRFAFALIEVGPVELFTGKNQQVSENLVVGFDLWFNNKRFPMQR
jgi:hypothetical protein